MRHAWQRFVAGALLALACTSAAAQSSAPASSERLKLIQQRGTLVVGVKTDYPPFGMVDSNGLPVGFEHDLAADIAKRLGVSLTKVSVTATTRLQKLNDGTIDLVLATLGDTIERRKIATLVEPDYYASGVTLLLPPKSPVHAWPDTRGKTVCAIHGAYFNRTIQQRYLLELQTYTSARDAKLALRDGRCAGFLFDNTGLMNDLLQPEWSKYEIPLPPSLETPWAIAIALPERGTEFDHFLGATVADWHRTGFLIERERAWHIPPSAFLAEAHGTWTRQQADGTPFCTRGADGTWRPECRHKVFLTSADVGGFAKAGLWLNERTGIDLSLVFDPVDRPLFLRGLFTSLWLIAACVVASLALGIVGACTAESRVPLLGALARGAGTVARMTPPLLAIYVVLFGIGSMLATEWAVSLPAAGIVVLCLSLYTGAGVMAALLHASAVVRHEDAAFRLRRSTLVRVVPLARAPVVAALVNVAKASTMASAVAVPELLSVTTSIVSERGNHAVMMNVLLVVFVLIIFAVVRVLHWLERQVLRHVTG